MSNRFDISGKAVVITGGAGLLGEMHAEAVAEKGGIPVLFDINYPKAKKIKKKIEKNFGVQCVAFRGDVTKEKKIKSLVKLLDGKKLKIGVLINNAAVNPKMVKGTINGAFEKYSIKNWNYELDVGLKGAFLCSQIIGEQMLRNKKGIIINISSDLGVIAPDQRIYQSNKKNLFYKPVTYSVIKHGIIGLTKYLSTYWAHKNIRVNCLCPGGVYEKQDQLFVKKVSNTIPMGRMAYRDEYKGAIQFLSSDASSYMNGSIMIIDGGRSVW